MNKRHLPRYSLDQRVLGISEPTNWADAFLPAYPHNNDGGTAGGGGGAAGGTGGPGNGGTDDGGTDDTEGGAKPLAEMTDAEKTEYWKRQARKHERAAKAAPAAEELAALREAKAELEKIRDGERTDTERAVKRADTAEKELAELRPRLLRLEVAYEAGLPSSLAHRLVGSTKEELEADAKELIKLAGDGKGDKGGAGRRAPALDQGARGTREDTKPTVSSGADLYAARRGTKTTANA